MDNKIKRAHIEKNVLISFKKGKNDFIAFCDFCNKKLNEYFETTVEIPRIRVGKKQTIETLINEEALLFAKYLRNEEGKWFPRIGKLG